MRLPAVLLCTCLAALAQIPAQDSRNLDPPNTDTHFAPIVHTSLAEWEARKQHLRRQILSAAGLMPLFPRNDLHPQIFGRVERGDYSVEKVLLEALPGYYLGGNLYRPLKAAPASGFPAVLSPHGHWNYGRLEHTNIASVPARCINLARQGYVVFAWDMVGYDDTIQTPHDFGDKPVEQLWGFGPYGLQLWNGIRALDFVESLQGVDRRRIGITGASGGATQTMGLDAVDDRIQFAAPANMVSFIMQGGSLCENAPNLRLGTNNVEIASMIAPKPMLMTAATEDWTRHMMQEEFPAVRSIYQLYGKPENVEALLLEAPHNYNQQNREAMYAFFGKHVLGIPDAAKLREKSVHLEKLEDVLALHNRTLPANAVTFEQLFAMWVRMSREQTGDERERLTYALAAEWPEKVLSERRGERVVLSRAGKGDRIPGIWIAGSNSPALVVHPDGAEAARKSPEVAQLIQQGHSVLLIDAFQTGSAVAPRKRDVKMFLTFNKSDDAERVQDILTALAWLKTPQKELVGLGKAAIWCTFAAVVAREPLAIRADLGSFTGTDEQFVKDFFVPDIQRAGGLKAALALVHRVSQ
jgi:dienelactone hydrolase